jgi:hypothetical protein
MQMFTRVIFFDKVKNWMMPYDPSTHVPVLIWAEKDSQDYSQQLSIALTAQISMKEDGERTKVLK